MAEESAGAASLPDRIALGVLTRLVTRELVEEVLADTGQPAWAALMAKKRRKTLIVCAPCHDHIYANPVTHAA